MKEKILEIQLWFAVNKKSILKVIGTMIPVFMGIVIYIQLPLIIDYYWKLRLNHEAKGIIQHVETKRGITQTLEGGKLDVIGFNIDYQYQIEQKTISKSISIPRKLLSWKQQRVIKNWESGDSISVFYHSKNYYQSKLDIE